MTSAPNLTAPAGVAGGAPSTPQERFLHLLQEAERRHQETLHRALRAESHVHQLRQVFQQWQQQHQRQQLVDQQMQQLQVQRQMQSLHDALQQQQQKTQLQMREQMDELYTFQQLQAFAHQQHLGQLQVQLFSLERSQRAERRNRHVLQRQMGQSRRSARQSPLATSPAAAAQPDPCCQEGVCCPCVFPEDCPYTPCFPADECCQIDIPEGPEEDRCFLRDMRLGFVQPPPCAECNSQRSPKRRRKATQYYQASESGYDADDEADYEASLTSVVSSGKSSSFKEERRQILQEVRNLENTRLVPRYKQVWKPLRCFHCGKLDHLATFCPHQPTTVL